MVMRSSFGLLTFLIFTTSVIASQKCGSHLAFERRVAQRRLAGAARSNAACTLNVCRFERRDGLQTLVSWIGSVLGTRISSLLGWNNGYNNGGQQGSNNGGQSSGQSGSDNQSTVDSSSGSTVDSSSGGTVDSSSGSKVDSSSGSKVDSSSGSTVDSSSGSTVNSNSDTQGGTMTTAASGNVPALETESLFQSGPPENRIDIMFFADGYLDSERSKFMEDAKKMAEDMSGAKAYHSVKPLLNFWASFTPSSQSGIGNGAASNTPFGVFRSASITRLVEHSNNGVVDAACQSMGEKCDFPVLIGNDDGYGGSGGQTVVVSSSPDSPRVLRHELGHTIVQIGDEYDGSYAYFGANSAPDQNQVPWQHWMGENGIGTFPTVSDKQTTTYRPTENNCVMRALEDPEFCSPCLEGLWLALLKRVNLIDSIDAPCGKGANSTTRTIEAQLVPLAHLRDGAEESTGDSYKITWKKDGQPVPDSDDKTAITVPDKDAAGKYTVEVTYSTPEVRVDTDGVLAKTLDYTVEGSCSK